MTLHVYSRDAIAKALGMSKGAIQQRHNRGTMPGPDVVFQGANGALSYGWKPETIEEWAPTIGRTVDWSRNKEKASASREAHDSVPAQLRVR